MWCYQESRHCQETSRTTSWEINAYAKIWRRVPLKLWAACNPSFWKHLQSFHCVQNWKRGKHILKMSIFPRCQARRTLPQTQYHLIDYKSEPTLHQREQSYCLILLTYTSQHFSFYIPFSHTYFLLFSPFSLSSYFQVSLPFLGCIHVLFLSRTAILTGFKAGRDFSDHPVQLPPSSPENSPISSGKKPQLLAEPRCQSTMLKMGWMSDPCILKQLPEAEAWGAFLKACRWE